MSKPAGRLAFLFLALFMAVAAALPLSGIAAQETGITLNQSVQISFPAYMEFKVSASSDASIVSLRLHYRVERQNIADVTSEAWALFQPATSVNTSWTWDMRKSSLPPGSVVEYWWVARDASGRNQSSAVSRVSFDDQRYRWQSLDRGAVTLLWYRGSNSFATELMGASQDALVRLRELTGVQSPPGKVRIYIYAGTADLQGGLVFPQEWTGGVTFTGHNTIAIGISESMLEWGKSTLAHELTHWLVGSLTFNNYGAGLPTWLEEGLATNGEGPQSADAANRRNTLQTAIAQNKLISVRSLSSPFSAIPDQAYISYAESHSIVEFLISEYGSEKMLQLLAVFQEGSTHDDALQQVYGFDQDGLDRLWRAGLGIAPAASLAPGMKAASFSFAGAGA